MEAVALHPGVTDRLGKGDQLRDGGLPPVEAGVEAGHLRDTGELLLHRLDGAEVVRLVQRGKGDEGLEVPHHFGCDDAGAGVLGPSVHHPVPDAEDPGAAVAGAEPGGELGEGEPPILDRGVELLVRQRAPISILGGEAGGSADPVDLPPRLEPPRRPVGAAVDART